MEGETKEQWQERMGIGQRSVGIGPRHIGTERKTPVLADATGKQVGFHTEHWSGRQDATVTSASVTLNPELRAEVVRHDRTG